MYTQFITIQEADRLRQGIDPEKKWLSDEDLERCIRVAGGQLDKAVIRCFLNIQQKASMQKDKVSVVWARNQLTRYEAGFLKI